MLGILSSFQRWSESFWLICSFDNHLSTYGNFCLADVVSRVHGFCYKCVKVADGSIVCSCGGAS